MRSAFVLLCLFLVVSPLAASPVTTVILVRHAEKAAAPEFDPPLTETGIERAKELSRMLAAVPIDAIYSTDYRRTRDTAAPLAEARGLSTTVLTDTKSYAADVAARIRARHAGKVVLVVGHSNTTRTTLRELGVSDAREIPESEYDNLFIVTLHEGKATMLRMRFGGR